MAEAESRPGVVRFARMLPRRHQLAVGVSGVIAPATVGLDTVALALLVPVIEFMANVDAGSADLLAVDWLRAAFDGVGLAFTLKWTLIATLVAMSARGAEGPGPDAVCCISTGPTCGWITWRTRIRGGPEMGASAPAFGVT